MAMFTAVKMKNSSESSRISQTGFNQESIFIPFNDDRRFIWRYVSDRAEPVQNVLKPVLKPVQKLKASVGTYFWNLVHLVTDSLESLRISSPHSPSLTVSLTPDFYRIIISRFWRNVSFWQANFIHALSVHSFTYSCRFWHSVAPFSVNM